MAYDFVLCFVDKCSIGNFYARVLPGCKFMCDCAFYGALWYLTACVCVCLLVTHIAVFYA